MENQKQERAAPPHSLADTEPLSEKELKAAEGRVKAAARLAKKIGVSESSEYGRMVAEIRRWRAQYAPRKLSPAKERRRAAMMLGIKADVATGRRVTLVTLSVAEVLQTAAELTEEELRLIRFDIPGLCLAPRRQ